MSEAEYRVNIFQRHFGSDGILYVFIDFIPPEHYMRDAERSAGILGREGQPLKGVRKLSFVLKTADDPAPRKLFSVVDLEYGNDRTFETRILDALVEAGNVVVVYKNGGVTSGLVVIDNQRVIPRQFEGTDRLTSDSDAIGDINAATISGSVSRGDLSVELVRGDGSRNEGFALRRVDDEFQWERVR